MLRSLLGCVPSPSPCGCSSPNVTEDIDAENVMLSFCQASELQMLSSSSRQMAKNLRFGEDSVEFLCRRQDLNFLPCTSAHLLAAGLSFKAVVGESSDDKSILRSREGQSVKIADMKGDLGMAQFALGQYVRSLAIISVAKRAAKAHPVGDQSLTGQLVDLKQRQRSLRRVANRIVASCLNPPTEHAGRAALDIYLTRGQDLPLDNTRAAAMYGTFVSKLIFLVRTLVLRRQWEATFHEPLKQHQEQLLNISWGWDLYKEAAADLIHSFMHLKHRIKKNAWPDLKDTAALIGNIGSYLV
jgi:hypothetical protein